MCFALMLLVLFRVRRAFTHQLYHHIFECNELPAVLALTEEMPLSNVENTDSLTVDVFKLLSLHFTPNPW